MLSSGGFCIAWICTQAVNSIKELLGIEGFLSPKLIIEGGKVVAFKEHSKKVI